MERYAFYKLRKVKNIGNKTVNFNYGAGALSVSNTITLRPKVMWGRMLSVKKCN